MMSHPFVVLRFVFGSDLIQLIVLCAFVMFQILFKFSHHYISHMIYFSMCNTIIVNVKFLSFGIQVGIGGISPDDNFGLKHPTFLPVTRWLESGVRTAPTTLFFFYITTLCR